jgi:hypothetical protein
VLGDIGPVKHLAKMKIVTEKDPAHTMKGGAPFYFVREARQGAIGVRELKGGSASTRLETSCFSLKPR